MSITRTIQKRHSLSVKTISQIIESIYDCALDPTCWEETLCMIVKHCRSQFGLLRIVDLNDERSILTIHVGHDDYYQKLHDTLYGAFNPYLNSLRSLPVGAVATRGMLIDDKEFRGSRFYNEWVEPQQICDAVGFNAFQTKRRVALFAAHRSQTEGRYCDNDVELVGLLAPHVCRAIAISYGLNREHVRNQYLESSIDRLSCGLCLCNSNGQIIYCNSSAELLLSSSDAVRFSHHYLVPHDPKARQALNNAIEQITHSSADLAPAPTTLALPGTKQGLSLIATVIPLQRNTRAALYDGTGATAAIFIKDARHKVEIPSDVIADLYGLTHCELRVLMAVFPSRCIKEAAKLSRISEATAKTHLRHIHEKTGTKKITELMHLVTKAVMPVCANESTPSASIRTRNRPAR